MTYLRLADSMDAAETLFKPVGVPGQIIIDYEMCPLQVDAFAGCICGNENLGIFVLSKQLFCFATILPTHTAVNGYYCFRPADQGADSLLQVVQSIAMLRENNQFAAVAVGVEHLGLILEQT